MDDTSDPNAPLPDGDGNEEPWMDDKSDVHASDGDEEPIEASIPIGISESPYLELQEANNISRAAYKEIMTIALESNTWVVASPAFGSLEEIMQMFHSLPSPGMRVEFSLESADVPIQPYYLVSLMMDVERWASLLSPMVCRGSADVPPGALQHLNRIDEAIKRTLMVDAEFQLPTPFVQRRKFRFLRCLRSIMQDIWAIVDVSIDYFPHTSDLISEQKCRRRPSGLIVRRCENHSQVIWIENVEVPEFQLQDSIYTGIINSNIAFSAKLWVSTLIWKLKRDYNKRLITAEMYVGIEDHTRFRNLTESMKIVYLDIVREPTDESKWVTLSNQGVRILRNATEDSINYVAVTSFRVQAEPLSVFNFLMRKNVELQWAGSLNFEEPEEMIKSVSNDDDSYCVTLHKKGFEYMLQEASMDRFCSFIISAPMTWLDISESIYVGRCGDSLLQPSGFAIMADGSDGFHSDASLVTIAMQREIDFPETDQAIESMRILISSIIREIREEVSTGRVASI